MSDPQQPPSMTVPFLSTVAASLMLTCGFFTALGSPPFFCALVIFLAVPVMILSSAYQWAIYFRKHVEYRIEQIAARQAQTAD